MDILQLRYFKEVSECQSLTKAADKLMISVPSLSATIKRLEQDVGCNLFDRVGRRIQLNNNGYILLRHTNDILNSLQQAEVELNSSSRCTLRLGLSSPALWAGAINQFLTNNPQATITYSIISYADINSPTLRSKFDFIIAATTDFNAPDWDCYILVEEDWPMLIVHPDHRFAHLDKINLRDARNEPFIALTRGTLSRKYFDDLCCSAGFSPNVVITCDYLLRTPLIRSKYGIAVTTWVGSKTEILADLKCIRIVEPKQPRAQTLFHYKKNQLSPIALEFRDFVRNYYQTL